MIKKALLLAAASLSLCTAAEAQMRCGTDELYNRLKALNPQIAINEAAQEAFIYDKTMVHPIQNALMRGTASSTSDTNDIYDIPLVFHIIHNYGPEYVTDNQIYQEVAYINRTYSRTSPDTALVILPYAHNIPGTNIKYIGRAGIRFHLATIDPQGKPTNGIVRHYSYLTSNAGDEAKFDPWPANKYVNIYLINRFGGSHAGAAAYAYPPSSGAANPYADGVIGFYDYLGNDNTYAHELGHVFNLAHPWGGTNQPEVACGDDGVDDTPPTRGHAPDKGNSPNKCDRDKAGPTAAIWDTVCALGYKKSYNAMQKVALYGGDTVAITIDYPDTTNAQNIMDYTYCSKMFTYGQTIRMRAALNSDLAGRKNLWQPANLAATGALSPVPDLAPIADFSVNKVFTCANTSGTTAQVTFTNRSYRDTVTSATWTFSNGTPATSNSLTTAITSFNQVGWVNATLTANSNAGTGSITKVNAVYAADPNPVNPEGYYQEFNGGDVDQFPIFNYYDSSNYKWEIYHTGVYDQSCIRFKNYDPRTNPSQNTITQTPAGLFADFYTRAFDLSSSSLTNRALLTFFTAGVYRVTASDKMNDSLEVYYSTSCGTSWTKIFPVIAKSAISTKYQNAEFTPGVIEDWQLRGMTIPSAAKTNKTFFRFRYKPGVDNTALSGTSGIGTGNNFYLDRINITSNALGVNTAELAARGVTLSPNPTSGSATVMIKGGDNSAAQIIVTDIAGRVVYRTEVKLNAAATEVIVPADKISVKGMYLVQVVANGNASTHKLVTY